MAKKSIKIESVMHPFPHSIGAGLNLEQAKEMMSEHNIRHLPVQEGGRLKGILTDRDINFALAMDKVDAEQILVRDAFTEDPYVVTEGEDVARVARKMAVEHIGCALITTKNESLSGIFTTVDACRVLAEVLSERYDQ
jgi:acetoin utilization protein AcuB